MMAAHKMPDLLDVLPPLRGRMMAQAPLGPSTWFRVGGTAELLVRPADAADLCALLVALPDDIKLFVMGAASNLIVRDGGIAGIVLRLGRGFSDIAADETGVTVGAAALDATVAEVAASAGLGGLEFLSGIPGTIGGAVAMNAGAYGGDVAGVLEWAEIATRTGTIRRLTKADLAFEYRHAAIPEGAVVTRARLRSAPDDVNAIAARMLKIRESRGATQPVRARTGGSTFRNPPGARAWALIDAAGARGLRRGGAQVSELHCNFMLNTGDATAADIEGLGEQVREKVRDHSGVDLHWEICRIGLPA